MLTVEEDVRNFMKNGKRVRRICLCVCACAAAAALICVAACAEDLTVHDFNSDDAKTFNDGMTNIAAYSGDYTVGLTKTVGDESDGYIFSYNAAHVGQTDSSDGRLIAAATSNGTITSGVYFEYDANSRTATAYTGSSTSDAVSAENAKLKSNSSDKSTTIVYDHFTSLGWLPKLLVQSENVTKVSETDISEAKEGITAFVIKVIEGVGALDEVDTSKISSSNLIVESNAYCEEFILEGGLLSYTMQFAAAEASNVGCDYPSFTYLKIELAGQEASTTIECYVSFDYAPANWNGPTSD